MTDLTRITQQSSRVLSLVLERQRLVSLSPGVSPPSSQLNQILRGLSQLRASILEQESLGPDESELLKPLRQQWTRMKNMLGEEAASIDDLPPPPQPPPPPPPKSPLLTTYSGNDPIDTPYTDDPDSPPPRDTPHDPHEMIGLQQQMIEGMSYT
ncbi:hypothetical protein FRB99_007775 [Tulasnella sp. 403]|nr:hypothetical protein FRB99_007775 [Tulasnella sp. 403]